MQANSALVALLEQIDHVIGQLEPADYARPLPEFDGSTLGQHFRHILEFLQCLQEGVASGMVDYAARQRNVLYEENPRVAAGVFANFVEVLPAFDSRKHILVRAEFGGADRPEYDSTVGRELVFVYDHAIHHLAIIKIGLRCHFPGVQTDRDLGVSPSTIKAKAFKTAE